MRWSEAFLPTLREDPAEAEAPSHRLLLRAGFVRQLAAGIYSDLPLARRVLAKIEGIVREEMVAIGGQEFLLPALHPAEIWKESGRWEQLGEELFRLRDRRNAELCLGATHEEIFTDLARREIRSYRQLPQIWFQFQTKFRDEPRPKSGVLRTRQFTMKDSYSFDLDVEGLSRSFERHAQAYRRIFSRCGLETIAVEASSGTMGGSESVEFMAFSDFGEDRVVRCAACGYAANLEKAAGKPTPLEAVEDSAPPEPFPTPGVRTIEDLARFQGGAPAERQIKTLLYVADERRVLLLLRGDHDLNEVKAAEALGVSRLRPAHAEEIVETLGAAAGSLGAVGVRDVPTWVDEALRGARGMTTGANRDDFHLRHVDLERDVPEPRWCDLREVREGDRCARCDAKLGIVRAVEVGHIFKLGRRYSEPMGARVLTEEGKEVALVMGSYGIGLQRLMAAVVEAHHDEHGICWPVSIAPHEVVVVPVKVTDERQRAVAERLYHELSAAGVEAILDDRDERPGVKFNDSDLIGIPFRVIVGPRSLNRGAVELFERATGKLSDMSIEQAASRVAEKIA